MTRRTRTLLVLASSAVLLAPVGWLVSDALERDNDFCNACHLEPGVPLHRAIRADFDRVPATSLAAAHARAGVEQRSDDPGFRCIDCHGGVGLAGRLRVKWLAARDAFWWLTGRFDEPDHMAWPLRDADCTRCHTGFEAVSEPGPGGVVPYHGLPVHNAEARVACVECHLSHVPDANAEFAFLHPRHVRRQCARCHTRFEEGSP